VRECFIIIITIIKKKNEQERSRFFYTSNVILVDAGNITDFYQYVDFARQYYSRDVIDRVLNSIIITRPFTVYQLADIVINQLPKIIQLYEAKLVDISDLLEIFIRDPQIEANEVRYLINEILNSIIKLRALEDVLVIVSLPSVDSSTYHHNDKPSTLYNKMILPRFDKHIEIMNSEDKENKMIDIKIGNNSPNIRRIKNNHDLFLSIKERDLLTLEQRSS
jgi:hypothetical protein